LIKGYLKYNLLCLIACAGIAVSGETAVEPAQSIPLFLKIITYDANFVPEKYDNIRVYTIYDSSIPLSYKQFLDAEEFFKGRPQLVVSGVHILHQPIPLDQVDSIFKQASDSEYRALLVTNIGQEKINRLSKKTQLFGVKSFSLCPDYVPQGLSIGVRPEEESKTILVNLRSSRLEGSNFSAHLLKICEIYKE